MHFFFEAMGSISNMGRSQAVGDWGLGQGNFSNLQSDIIRTTL